MKLNGNVFRLICRILTKNEDINAVEGCLLRIHSDRFDFVRILLRFISNYDCNTIVSINIRSLYFYNIQTNTNRIIRLFRFDYEKKNY